jgi:hypothetical protein
MNQFFGRSERICRVSLTAELERLSTEPMNFDEELPGAGSRSALNELVGSAGFSLGKPATL